MMIISLGIFAAIIFAVYSFYFIKIIKGKPEEFEREILSALAGWMIEKGTASSRQMWFIMGFSVLMELIYFTMVFLSINNPAIIIFTGFFAGLELFHILFLSATIHRFFKGKIQLKAIFNWRLERLSALLFFTHSLLILLLLIFF